MIVCTACHSEKDSTEFRKDKYSPTGYTYRCKSCLKNDYLRQKPYLQKKFATRAKEARAIRESIAIQKPDPVSKVCKMCKVEMSIDNFYKYNCKQLYKGYKFEACCKHCKMKHLQKVQDKDRKRSSQRKWFIKNKDRRDAQNKAWRDRNQERVKEMRRKRENRLRATDSIFRAKVNLSSRMRVFLKKLGCVKSQCIQDILGCDNITLLKCLGEYTIGMELDHICPLSQAKTEEEVYKLNHYANLQWLPKYINREKLDKRTVKGVILCNALLGRDWID